jgi:ketosteroid isomerase-like protein
LDELAKVEPAHAFWVIKHGLKMSGMPAWGVTMYDSALWDMVAALPKIAKMSPEQYKKLVTGVEETGQKHPDEKPANSSEPAAAPDGASTNVGAPNPDMSAMKGMKGMSGMAGMKGMPDMQDKPAMPTALDAGFKAKAVPAAEAAAEAFHAALQKGDRNAVLALLSAEVSIIEDGKTQSRDEYASGHMGEDFAFLKHARIKLLSLASMAMGDSAMVSSRSEMRASHEGVPMSMLSSEVLTLKQTPAGWKIVKVQWASNPIPGA